jgi:DNA-directed RNA polymerase subunit RPC12/RpoP
MMNTGGIKVKCRHCNKESNSDTFTLDPVYGMMVCQNCVNERRSKSFSIKKGVKEEPKPVENKPKGWDAEDDMLTKSYKQKVESYVQVKKVDTDKVKYKCPKCKYEFVYNVDKNQPPKCPYCNSPIMKFRL